MPDPKHVKWLLEGRRAWNARRAAEHFIPDLSGQDIAASLVEASIVSKEGNPDLSLIDLSKALLSGCNFSDTLLDGANLSKADLGLARFINARLTLADLTGAHLQEAKLSGADLTGAKLGQAYLEDCDLKQAKVAGADLVGANLTGSRFWRASMSSLVSHEWELYPHVSLDGRVTAINDILQNISELKDHYTSDELKEPPIFYFRGESKEDWDLTPNVMRRCKDNDDSIRDVEGPMLVDLRSRRAGDFDAAHSALEQMVIAQHHGLPTRLLDITRNPLVALFHASHKVRKYPDVNGRIHVFVVPSFLMKPFNSDAVSVISNFSSLRRSEQNLVLGKTTAETEDDVDPGYCTELQPGQSYSLAMNRLYQFIRLEKPSFQERINPKDLLRVFIVEPQQSFERIRAQSGAFLISALHERFEEEAIREWCDDLPVYHHYTLTVPTNSKGDIKEELTTFNITHETMFPGLDQAAKSVTAHYREASIVRSQAASKVNDLPC